MATAPQFIGTPKSPTVLIATANTNRDGTTGTYGTLFTAGASGSRIDRIRVNAQVSTTAGMVRFFLSDSLILEIPVQIVTVAATTPAWYADIIFENGLIMAAASVLKCSTEKAESIAVTVISGGDF